MFLFAFFVFLFFFFFFFFFNDTATTEIYTLSLHDALPISAQTSSPSAWMPSSLVMRMRIGSLHLPRLRGRESFVRGEAWFSIIAPARWSSTRPYSSAARPVPRSTHLAADRSPSPR